MPSPDHARTVPEMSERRTIEQNSQRRARPREIPSKGVRNAKLEEIVVTRKEKDSKQQPSADIPLPCDRSQGTSISSQDGKKSLPRTPKNCEQSFVLSPSPCSTESRATEPSNKSRWVISPRRPLDLVRTVRRRPLLGVGEGSGGEDTRPVKRRMLSRGWKQPKSSGVRPNHERHISISSDRMSDSSMEWHRSGFL